MFTNDTDFLDQHFLIDKEIIANFLQACDLKDSDVVVEIGPGKGTMTKLIAPLVKDLTVIELDKRLALYLDSIPNIKVIYDSVLNIDIPQCNKIITSLPYSITEPFIYQLTKTKFDKLIMICGNKFALGVKKNDASKLSILTNLFFKVHYLQEILPNSFKPAPKALSALITLEPLDINDLTTSEKIMRYLYNYRYLKVKNALKEIYIKLNNISQRQSKEIINKMSIDDIILNKQFDELNNAETALLFNILKEHN